MLESLWAMHSLSEVLKAQLRSIWGLAFRSPYLTLSLYGEKEELKRKATHRKHYSGLSLASELQLLAKCLRPTVWPTLHP